MAMPRFEFRHTSLTQPQPTCLTQPCQYKSLWFDCSRKLSHTVLLFEETSRGGIIQRIQYADGVRTRSAGRRRRKRTAPRLERRRPERARKVDSHRL